jgi:formylglycine-generating enzyme required for sulfatase activity
MKRTLLSILFVLFASAALAHAANPFAEGFEFIKAGKLAEAAVKFEAGLKAEPDNAIAHFYLAEAYLGLKQNDKAKAAYEKALKLEPFGANALDAKQRLAQISSDGKTKLSGVFKDCDGCPAMVTIPAGKFIMGSPPNEAGRDDDEGPPHLVTIEQPFALGKTEVTVGQFRGFVKAVGYTTDAEREGKCWTVNDKREWAELSGANWTNPGFSQGDDHPVACVSWNDARAYIAWLREKSGQRYRLPSEAEWEYAARAGTTRKWIWGVDEDDSCQMANIGDLTVKEHYPSWTTTLCRDKYLYTAPVGSFSANRFGLHDMIGNVWEWAQDCYNKSYDNAPTDGSAWIGGDCSLRVERGGSWGNTPAGARSAIRDGDAPTRRGSYLGFRVARTLP